MSDDRRTLRDRADRGQSDREAWLAQREELNAQVRENMPTLDAILPSHMNAAQFTAIVSGLIARNDDLALAAIANPVSFLAALADCARLGLVPGDGYALVPLGVSENSTPTSKAEVLGMTEYTGEIELIYRTGLVEAVIAELVRENDHYVPGKHAHQAPEFARGPSEFATDKQRGEIIGAFCYCVLKGGGNTRIVSMNMDEINRHEEVARTKKIWRGPFRGSMILKTVVHEQYKWVAKSPEFREILTGATAALGGSTLGALTPAPAIELDASPAPTLKVRAIGAAPRPAPQRRGRDGNRTPYGTVMSLFERIGVTDASEQLAVVKAVCPDYETGSKISDEQATAVAEQLQHFIDDADDIGEPGSDDEFAGQTPYDVMRTWLASPADADSSVPDPGNAE